MIRKKIDLTEILVVIKNEERKVFSIHPGLMEPMITREIAQLRKQGKNILCFSTSQVSSQIITHFTKLGYRQVEDVKSQQY